LNYTSFVRHNILNA